MRIFFNLLIPAVMVWSCGENRNVRETVSTIASDSLVAPRDSVVVVKDVGDPNVYTIPADYPWLVKLIGERFPWDSASMCSRIAAFDDLFSDASITKDQVGDDLVAVYEFKGSYIKVAQLHFDEMQDCMDNICEVVLTSDWVPIGLGLHIGMTKAEFLEALSLDINSPQHIFKYVFMADNTHSISVVFEFKDDVLSFFSYFVDPSKSYQLRVPRQPFFTKLFNKPFLTMKPDSVQQIVKTKVDITVQRNMEYQRVDKVGESDAQPEFRFDSSMMKFEKWPAWQIVYADLKSPNFGLINGIRVGMERAAFLEVLCEKDFEGDEFHQGNRYCADGFDNGNDLAVFFKDGVIREIVYQRWRCQ